MKFFQIIRTKKRLGSFSVTLLAVLIGISFSIDAMEIKVSIAWLKGQTMTVVQGSNVYSILASGIMKTTDVKSGNSTWSLVKPPTVDGLFTKTSEVPETTIVAFTPNEEVVVPYTVVPKNKEPLSPKKEGPQENKGKEQPRPDKKQFQKSIHGLMPRDKTRATLR